MHTIRVAIGDDDRAFREALVDILAADPRFEVVGAVASGDELCRLAAETRPDVALVDIRMPAGGADAVRALRQQDAELAGGPARTGALVVVAVSAHTGVTDVVDMLRAGATGYLAKGRLGGSLPELVERCAAGEVVLAVPTGSRAIGLLAAS